MSNSSLVTYRYLVNNKTNGRDGKKIEKIFVHHMAGNLTVKQCGNVFRNRPASAHYGINGNAIGQYVDEKNTAWHCGNFNWNQRSIGIELANSTGAKGGWQVADSTINTAIRLIADICKRNGITKLVYTGDMSGNLCMHRWVASTACPGPYLSKQFKRIETGVNALLGKDISKLQETIKASQKFFGTTADGWISGQVYDCRKHFQALEDAVDSWDCAGSPFIKALQTWLKVDADGLLGKDTVTAWQKKIGTDADGYFGPNSLKAWEDYLAKETTTPTTPSSEQSATKTLYRVRKSWDAPKSQAGAYRNLENAKKVADEKGLNVYGDNGTLIYTGKKASTWVDKANAWAKEIADSKYHYVVWKSNVQATKTCPICTGRKYDNYYGWNCIGFALAVWHHGGGLKNNCNCSAISNGIGEDMYNAKTDADALAMAKKRLGLSELTIIRNKSGIPKAQWKAGDICLQFSGSTYKHMFYYMGNGKVADAGNYKSTASQIAVRDASRYSAKIIIRYTGE